MKRILLIAAAIAGLLGLQSLPALADDASPAEARALLVRAINEVKINRTAALAKFNRPDGGFVDRDLYVFCFGGSDGKTVAHVSKDQLGLDVRAMRDATGYAFGDALFRDTRQGSIKTFAYMWPRPGEAKPAAKESFATRIGGLVCGVGYYK
jgi:hypothetical protein